jgi:hypothetical protein
VQTGALAEAADKRPPVTNVLASVDDSLDVANVIVGAMLGAQSSRPSGGAATNAHRSMSVTRGWRRQDHIRKITRQLKLVINASLFSCLSPATVFSK